jgi:hypothetical protein
MGNYSYGWRLFEFCISDATMTETVEDNIAFYKFKTLKISYINNTGTYIESNKNKFSFYHVFLAKSFSSYTTVVDSQSYVQYKLNSNFVSEKAYYVDDEILFTNVKSLFDVLIIGQTNLRDYSNNNYSFELSVQSPDGDITNKYFGEKFIFDAVGYYRVSCSVKEYRTDKSEVVLFEQMDLLAIEGITKKELDNAKKYLLASYNLRFKSTLELSNMLTEMQKYKLGLDFLQKRNDYVRNVTLQDVNNVIAKYYKDKPKEVAIGLIK